MVILSTISIVIQNIKTLCTKYGIKGNNLSQFVIFLENDVPSYLIILIKPKQYQNQINTNT